MRIITSILGNKYVQVVVVVLLFNIPVMLHFYFEQHRVRDVNIEMQQLRLLREVEEGLSKSIEDQQKDNRRLLEEIHRNSEKLERLSR